MLEITNENCMELMARYPDKYWDIAIIDPPYGIGFDGEVKQMANNSSKKWTWLPE
jgi:site-specific DNA-methyltransferase (adenine-specific)